MGKEELAALSRMKCSTVFIFNQEPHTKHWYLHHIKQIPHNTKDDFWFCESKYMFFCNENICYVSTTKLASCLVQLKPLLIAENKKKVFALSSMIKC